MKMCLLGIFVIGLLVAADDKKPEDVKAQLKGAWMIESIERGGEKLPADKLKEQSLTFEGDKVSFTKDDDTLNGTYKIDLTQKPPHLDITPDDDKKTMKTLFQLDGDTLKLAVGVGPGLERPKGFDSKDTLVITLKRDK